MIKPVQIPALSGEGLPFSTPRGGITDSWLMAAEEGRVTLGGWPLVGCPYPSSWHYSHVQRGSTNWIQWVVTKEMNLGERLIEEGGGWKGREGDMTKVHHHTWVRNFQNRRKQNAFIIKTAELLWLTKETGSWINLSLHLPHHICLKELDFFSRHKYSWKTQILLPDGGKCACQGNTPAFIVEAQ